MRPTIRTLASRAVTVVCLGLVALLAPASATALASFEAFAMSVLELKTAGGELPQGVIVSTSGEQTGESTAVAPDLGPLSEAFAQANAGTGAPPPFSGTDNLPSLAELEAQLQQELDDQQIDFVVDFSFDDTAGYAQSFVFGTADTPDWVGAGALAELTVTLENTDEVEIEVEVVVATAIALSYTELDDPLLESALASADASVSETSLMVEAIAIAEVPPGTDPYEQRIAISTGTFVIPAASSLSFSLSAEALGQAHAPIPEPGAALLFAVGAIAMAGPLRGARRSR